MKEKMEATGRIGIMWGIYRDNEKNGTTGILGIIGLYRGYIGITEKKWKLL